MKLNRKQELRLIDLGLNQIINEYLKPVVHKPKKKIQKRFKMSLADRRAISKRMKAMWRRKRNAT